MRKYKTGEVQYPQQGQEPLYYRKLTMPTITDRKLRISAHF